MYKSVTRYNIKYLTNEKNSIKYLNVDEESMLLYYDKMIKQASADEIISLDKYRKNIKTFNLYIKNIAIYINNHNKIETKKYMEKLLDIDDMESDILYLFFDFINNNFDSIKPNKDNIIKKI